MCLAVVILDLIYNLFCELSIKNLKKYVPIYKSAKDSQTDRKFDGKAELFESILILY